MTICLACCEKHCPPDKYVGCMNILLQQQAPKAEYSYTTLINSTEEIGKWDICDVCGKKTLCYECNFKHEWVIQKVESKQVNEGVRMLPEQKKPLLTSIALFQGLAAVFYGFGSTAKLTIISSSSFDESGYAPAESIAMYGKNELVKLKDFIATCLEQLDSQ